MISNRKPADELYDIRARMKELGEREQELREAMIAGECSLTGDDFQAVVRVRTQERLDTAKLRKELGPERLQPYLRDRQFHYVELVGIHGGRNPRAWSWKWDRKKVSGYGKRETKGVVTPTVSENG